MPRFGPRTIPGRANNFQFIPTPQPPDATSGPSLMERLAVSNLRFTKLAEDIGWQIRVALPGIVQEFDENTQTVSVQLAITERMMNNGKLATFPISVLKDVPIVIPRMGGYCLTMPIQQGDECLVVFSDMSFDNWWLNGGTQDQVELRRHDLSDGFAIMGCWSQQRLVENYSTDSAQLRTDDGQTVVDIQPNLITLTAQNIVLDGDVEVTGTLTADDDVIAGTISLEEHIHGYGDDLLTQPPKV